MATELIAPPPKLYFTDSAGAPLAGGKLFTYAAGSTSKLATYTDSAGGTPNTNPIVLDSRGECDCWIPPATAFKFVLAPANDTDPPTNPIWTVDNIPSGLTGYNVTVSPNITVSPTGNPTGGSVPATLSSVNIQATAGSATLREFLLCVGLTSAVGSTTLYADKVAGYFGMVGNNGTHDIWSLNSVLQISAGSFAANSYNAQGYELDFNNLCQDIGNTAAGAGFAAPIAVGLSITGASTFKSTSAVLVSGATNQWNRGISFTNNCVAQASIQDLCNATVSYQMFGVHTTGIDMSAASCTYSTLVANGNGHFSLNQTGSSKLAFVQSSNNTMIIGDTGFTGIFSNNKILPNVNASYDLGSGVAQWGAIYCVSLTQSSNPELKTDISGVPDGLASKIIDALPISLFRWKKGGVDEVEGFEDQQIQATETVSWETEETELIDGVARLVKRTHTHEQPIFDELPALDETGRQAVTRVPAKPEIKDKTGKIIQEAQPGYDIPRFHRLPRMVTKSMPVRTLVDRPGKRLHLGAMAPDIQSAFASTGMDLSAYKEDGAFKGYQLDQIVWLSLKGLQEEGAARRAMESRLSALEARA